MRNHGWQPPFHPLQTVAIAVFCALAFSFYVFFAPFLGTETLKFVIIGLFTPLVGAVFVLYIACTWIDPADPGVHESKEKYNPKKVETGSGTDGQPLEEEKKSIQTYLEKREDGHEPTEPTGCKPLGQLAEKSCCKKKEAEELGSDEQGLYCSICDAEISAHSKHCRACDKCVHGFDHHCRWLNNCVGTRNYKPFVALMVSCLLMLILEWAVGIVVLVRCFSNKTSFDEEIVDKLGSSFPRVAFIVVLMFLTLLALLATAPLTQLFCFHLILMHKGITTYDYILAVREENQELWEENGGLSSLTTSPATSMETVSSGYSSSASAAAGKRIVFCTPPRMFVDQDQTIMALSDLEVGVGKAGGGKIIDAKSQQRPAPVGLNPWKLSRVTTEDAARAAARARAKSSILLPNRPGTALQTATVDTDSSFQSSSGEIRLAGSRRGRRKRNLPGLPREMWSKNKQDRISPLSEDSNAPNPDSSQEGLPPLPQEPRSPYRSSPNDAYSGDPRAFFPPQVSFPTQVLLPRFPGDENSITHLPVNSADVLRISANSDGYEASCGESGDDTSDAVGLSQSWNQASLKKLSLNPATPGYKEENVNPWVAFPASNLNQEVKGSPGGQSVSSGSRVEANILKVKPELRDARLQTSSPTVYEDSPLRKSSDFLSEDSTTSAGETPGRGTGTSSFFYSGPRPEPSVSSRRLMSAIIGSRSALSRATSESS